MISVIIPAYNLAPYLEHCVDSILKQTYTDFEVLLVNDGSTDETGDLCDKLALRDSRIRVFHKENGGVSSARNLALDNAKGDMISIIDGDDGVEPTLFEDAVNSMKQNNAQIFMFEYFVDKNGESVKHRVSDSKYGVLDTQTALIRSISPDNRFAWSKIFDKKLLLDTRFDENIILGEDTLFICEVITRAKSVFYSDNAYYHYIIRENSAITSAFNIRKMTGIDAYQKVLELFMNSGFKVAADYARAAIVDLGIALCQRASKSDVKKQAYKITKTAIKKLVVKTVSSQYVPLTTKLKAIVGTFSVNGAVLLCDMLGKKV